MGVPVVTVASGGMPVVDVTATTGRGTPVSEATNKFGSPVTKVASGGMAVAYETLVVWPPPVAPIVPVTWDIATVTAVTLSGSNLVATNTGTTSTDQGAKAAVASGKASGKYYFETTWSASTGGANNGIGVGTVSSTYIGMGNTGGVTGVTAFFLGSVWSNGSNVLSLGGGWSVGQVAAVAVDLDNRKIWFRLAPSGNWNNNATYNPATNVGGLTIPAGTMVPFVVFGGSGGAVNNVVTANFGLSAFTGAVPSGFTAGWPV